MQNRVAALVAALAISLAPLSAFAVAWTGVRNNTVGRGDVATYSTSSSEDSDAIAVPPEGCHFKNTGTTEITVYYADDSSGAKLTSKYKTVAPTGSSADCSTDAEACAATMLVGGAKYIADCAGSTCSATCKGR